MSSSWLTAVDLGELGERVAADGASAHHRLLVQVSRAARHLAPAAASVLADRTAPDVLRARALAVASRELGRTRPVHVRVA